MAVIVVTSQPRRKGQEDVSVVAQIDAAKRGHSSGGVPSKRTE
jgi:hypothetical protein